MIILDNKGKTIEMGLKNEVTMSKDRRHYQITSPVILCSSLTDAENIQKRLNTFVYNLTHEMLELDKKMTLEEIEKSMDKKED